MPLLLTRAALLATLIASGAAARAEEPVDTAVGPLPAGWPGSSDAICPARLERVLAIGSSTLGSPLGPILERALTKSGLDTKRLAAASSGLARPDFWDWAAHARRLVAEHDPDVVIVVIGANDYQPIWGEGRPIRRQHPEWERVYGRRIDELLAILGGGERERLIVWVGPYAYWGDNAREQGPVIDRLLKDRLTSWIARGGHARYVDAWAATYDPRRGPIMKRRMPGRRGLVEIRGKDNVHLNADAVRALLAEPTLAEVLGCLDEARAQATDDTHTQAPGADEATP